ncbi:BQ2448_4328 [Microbotryum intermedium]|uniref:BQ2448_4328 protein n=1 Tax=Microbotryum intermedium TaxID=269621 RepID=A0A238FKW6_9BASI|nr:BQ2448_4328 [Microbotryum intermedium]
MVSSSLLENAAKPESLPTQDASLCSLYGAAGHLIKATLGQRFSFATPKDRSTALQLGHRFDDYTFSRSMSTRPLLPLHCLHCPHGCDFHATPKSWHWGLEYDIVLRKNNPRTDSPFLWF